MHMQSKFTTLVLGLMVMGTVGISPNPAEAVPVYSNDFQTSVGSGWSSTGGTPIISTTPSGHKFLGRHSTLGFNNESVSLNLLGLPSHSDVTLSFDLYIIQSWDGNSGGVGPDIFDLGVTGGSTLLHTTFGTHFPRYQAFPGSYPGGSNPPNTGAAAVGSLGYTFFGDAVYSLSYTFAHSSSSLGLTFEDWGLQGIGDESWGLDNVLVSITPAGQPTTATPEPGTIVLMGSGLVGLVAWRMKKKQV